MTTPSRSTTRRPAWLVPVLVIAMAAVVLATVFVLGRGSAASSARTDRQLTTMHTSCDDWSRSDDGGADDRWCAEMVEWMRSADGGTMMGSQMWDRPDHMRASCRTWADNSRPAPMGRSDARCDDMVDWMQDHPRGDRDGHMMDWMQDHPRGDRDGDMMDGR